MQQGVRATGAIRLDTCLIVEDSEFDQQMMSRIVSRSHRDMQIEVANTLHSARKALGRGRVSLILLDNNLPDGLGANFALELASDQRFAGIPIIMVSDWPSPFMWEKAASADVLYVVNKAQFGARYVREALKHVRDRRRLKLPIESNAQS